MAVAHDHAAVEAVVSCSTCGNNLEFCGDEIVLFDVIFFFQDSQDVFLNRLFLLTLYRDAADQQVQILTLDDFGSCFCHLLTGQMRKQIGDSEYRIAVVVTDSDIYGCAVFFRNNAVESQRKSYPLIFLNSAVVVGIEHSHVVILIERILFQVDTRGVDVGSNDVHTIFQGFLTDLEHGKGFAHADRVNFVAGLQGLAGCDDVIQVFVAVSLCLSHC